MVRPPRANAAAEEPAMRVTRQTVDLSGFPDLVVIYLGMRVNSWSGLRTVMRFGPRLGKALDPYPEGLLLHEPVTWSLFPPHIGFRQYWRDFDALERWARSDPHRLWWKEFLKDSGGTGFWHETYLARGGIEAVYDDMQGAPVGMMRFAQVVDARGAMFSARSRARVDGPEHEARVVPESDL
jgi:hypothetical protein